MQVDENDYVARMGAQWTTKLKNTPSGNLQAVWRQQVQTFNAVIASYGTPEWLRWFVLRPETGTGKTQGACLYAAMLPVDDHPGVLMVVRLRKQADDLVSDINTTAGKQIAAAHHGDHRLTAAEMASTPTLIITHEAFKRGVAAASRGEDTYNWETYNAWRGDRRKLVIIDEELDLLVEYRATLSDLLDAKSTALKLFPTDFASQLKVLDKLEIELRQIEKDREANKSEHVLWEHWSGIDPDFSMSPLCDAIYASG
jgi:hypothetical protein